MRFRGFWRLAERRVRRDPAVAMLAWLLLVAGAALPATGLLYSEHVALGSLRTEFAAAAPRDRSVVVALSAPLEEVDRVDAGMAAVVGAAIAAAAPLEGSSTGDGTAGVVRVLRSGGLRLDPTPGTATAGQAPGDLVVLGSFENLAAHAALVDGRWPQAGGTPIQTTLSEGAAAALGLRIGDEVTVRDPLDPARSSTLRLAGIWRPDASDPYWLGDQLDLTGSETVRLTTRGPFAIARGDMVRAEAGANVQAEWRGLPAPDRLTPGSSAALQGDLGLLPGRAQAIAGTSRQVTVSTNLPAFLADLARKVEVGRELILLLVAEMAVVAGYALLLVGGVLAGRRRQDSVLLRERGAGSGQVAAVALIEGLLLGVPAAVAAAALATTVAELLAGPGVSGAAGASSESETLAFLVACVAAGFGALALAVPTLTEGVNLPAVRAALGRRVGRTLVQRLGLDLGLVVLAVLAIWQLRAYGAPSGSSGIGGSIPSDSRQVQGPVVLLAPAVGLLAGAIVVIRLVPRLAELAERGLGHLRGLVIPLGGRDVARRPARYTRVALLVVLAAALGMLATCHAATWTQSQADQAAYQVPTDVRVISGPAAGLPGWLAGPAYRALPGVTSATPILDRSIDAGPATGGQLLAIDPAAIAVIPDPPASLRAAAPEVAALAAGRPAPPGVALPAGTLRLAVTVDADLAVLIDATAPSVTPPPVPGVDVRLWLVDADGRVSSLDGGTAPPRAAGTRLEVALARPLGGRLTAPDDGLRLLAVEVAIAAPRGLGVGGSVELRGVEASSAGAPTAGPWTAVPVDPAASGWRWVRLDDARQTPYDPPAAHWGRIVMGTEPGATAPAGSTVLPTRFRLAATPDTTTPLPVLVNPAFLEATGAAVGDTVDGQVVGDGVRLRIIGTTDLFPPLDPARPFIVLDRRWFELARVGADGATVNADEWWLTTRPGLTGPTLAGALRAPPFLARDVLDQAALVAAGAADPISLGTSGALRLAALSALVFAVIGFIVHIAVSARERVAELALLRALGVSSRQVLAWLWVEHASILAFSLVAGSGVGLLLAWLILPSATLTSAGAAPVPPPTIVVPADFVGGLALVAAVLLALALAGVAHLVRRVDVPAELRSGAG